MDPFDQFRDLRRILDTLKPVLEQQARIERQLREAAVSLPMKGLLAEYDAVFRNLALVPDFSSTALALASAVRPLTIDFDKILPRVDFGSIAAVMNRVNAAIESARFLGEVEVASEKPDSESEDEAPTRNAEAQLIEIVPAEALENLKRVEFAPLRLLDRALRDPEILRCLDAREFEGFVAALVERLGFEDVVLTPRSGDDGRDVIATKRVHGLAILCAFECKRYAPNRRVGLGTARALLGTIMHGPTRAAKGVLVTTSYFTSGARRFILTEPSLDGKDFDGLVEWLKEYSDRGNTTT